MVSGAVNIVAPVQPTPTPLSGPRLAVNPVQSLTHLLSQTITGQTDPNVNVYITSQAGRFYERADAEGSFDDFDPLRAEPGVRVRYVSHREELGQPQAVILPGTKSTLGDLRWMQEQGLANAITVRL